ncbi:peptidase S15, partial [Amycolatopsis sp. NPDC000740]
MLNRIVDRLLGLPAAEGPAPIADKDLRIPMPDGTHLLADRFSPPGLTTGPAVLIRTPYGRTGPLARLFGETFA